MIFPFCEQRLTEDHAHSFLIPAVVLIVLAGWSYAPTGARSFGEHLWPLVPSFGIGQPQPDFNLLDASQPILSAILVANVPQILVSYFYLALNNIMTTMLAMAEWTSFARGAAAKGLRVSKPVPGSQQRSTYFLSAPYRWAVPSFVAFAALHWLFSQMVFLAQIKVYDYDGNVDTVNSITTVYFSPLAMLLAVGIASAVLLIVVGVAAFKHYPSGAPLAGCCSASISAACQPGPGKDEFDAEIWLRQLRWGVVDEAATEHDVGHATFSDMSVGGLVHGRMYA